MNPTWLAASLLVLLACGPTTDDCPISSVSLADLSDLCTGQIDAVSEAELRGLAHLTCVTFDRNEAECQPDALAECTEGIFAQLRARRGCELPAELAAPAQACQEPVQSMLDCIDGFFAEMPALTDLTCDDVSDLPDVHVLACDRLETACPGFTFEELEDYFYAR